MIMFPTITDHLLFLLMSILSCNCQVQSVFKLSVNEESPVGFVIGNIHNFVMNSFYTINPYEVTCVNKHFSISSNKDVRMMKVIDLEKICELENLCCNDGSCVIGSIVYVSTEDMKKYTFKIEIEIKDINDNKPIFKSPTQTIFIPENSKLNTFVRLETAIDNDVTMANKVQQYKLSEPTGTFHLDSSDLDFLKLILHKPIDYESKKLYNATLSACEQKNNCTTQILLINIEDENDNFPKFEKSKYEMRIREDFPVRSVILQLRAIDLDGPKYNKTIYSFSSNRDRIIERYFRIVAETGDIVLRSKLSASSKTHYRFRVSATDAKMSQVGDTRDIAEIVIDVIDINDHKPTIEIVRSDKVTEVGRFVKIRIKELDPGQKLVSMKVSDEDLGDNGRVECELKEASLPFDLKYFNPGLYELWSVSPFDYEENTMIRTLFECKDHGYIPLTEYRTIEVNIEDVNEFAPVFLQPIYKVFLRENAPPGTVAVTVQAKDRDGSASLIYSIQESKALEHFSIDRVSGVIKTTVNSFDKENTDELDFYVNVSDDRDNPKTAQAMVKINITDMNDNDPVFISSSLTFFVLENRKPKVLLNGMLNATDRDKGTDNSYVMYKLMHIYDHMLMKCDKEIFRMKTSGGIETLIELDRETNPNYTISIKAYDRGNPPRYTFANATVFVRDVNDNAPQWQYPRPLGHSRYKDTLIPMLNISESTDKMTLILKLKAYDIDDSDAGKVTYILQNHIEEMFALNATTGELITITAPLRHGQYKLQLIAIDNGIPPLQSVAWILINVLDSGKLANINLTIIIGMIAITVLISIFLIVAIICVRRRPRFQKYLPPSSEVVNDSSNQYFNHNHWMYHTEDNPMPPMSDNESFVFLPQQYCSNNHPDQIAIQTLNGSRPASRMEYPLTLPSSNNFSTIDNTNGLQMNQTIDRLNGTLRSNNGFYGSSIPTSMGVVLTGQELDGDSADSGKGASEVDLRLQHQLNIGNRNYTTLPFLHYSTATTSFGHYNNMAPNQYYSINTNPRALDSSRFLTVNTAHLPTGGRRVASPSNSNCQCFILPEDDVIQINQDSNGYSMSTFTNKSKLTNHEKNCIYNGDDMAPHLYADYPYGESSANMKDYMDIDPNDVSAADQRGDIDKSYNNLTDNNNTHNKNLFTTSDKNNPEKNNFYSIKLAN